MDTSTQTRTAVALLTSDEWGEAVKIARDILRDTERQALDCDDPAETIRLAHEARGAKKFLAQLLNAVTEMAK